MLDAILDLSHNNDLDGEPDEAFAKMRAAGILGVILKATQGIDFIDPTFRERAPAAAKAGLLVGAYHFCDDSRTDLQARFFADVAAPLAPLLALDIEPNGEHTCAIEGAEQIAANLSVAYRLTERPLVYVGRYGPTGDGRGLPSAGLSRYPLWLPHYAAGISLANYPAGWSDWRLWQHTDTGSCPGVIGDVDRSYFNGDEAALRAWWPKMPEAGV